MGRPKISDEEKIRNKQEYQKKYNAKNRKKLSEYSKKYRINNRDKYLEYQRKYNKTAIRKEHIKKWKEKNKDTVLLNSKKWYHANKDRSAKNHGVYYEKNRIKLIQYSKEWVEGNKNKAKENRKRLYEKNKIREREANRQWSRNNKGKIYAYLANRRDRKKLVCEPSRITQSFYKMIRIKFNNKCFNCSSNNKLTIDHHYPLVLGNPLSINNAVLLCKSCNSSKNKKLPESFYSPEQLSDLQLNYGISKSPIEEKQLSLFEARMPKNLERDNGILEAMNAA